MKKIYAILAVFLCVGMIAPVYGASIEQAYTDSWGRTCLFDNGDAIYFGQTVAVTESSIACVYDFEIIENCTVTVTTNNHVVVVDENGDRVISKNGVEFRYTSNWRITSCMTWNNFPYGGGKEEFTNFEVIDFETEGEAGFYMGACTIKGAHSPDEYMIVQKGTWTSMDVKAHAVAKGVEYVYVLQFPRAGDEPVKHVEVVDKDFFMSVINSVCNGIDYTQFPETITYGDMTFELSSYHTFEHEDYKYDYYWRTTEGWAPYINILGAGPVMLYDDFDVGEIYSESQGLLEFYTYDEFMSALNTVDDAYEVAILTVDSNDWKNNMCIDINIEEW